MTFDRAARTVTLTVRAPEGDQPRNDRSDSRLGDQWWPLAMARELDDAILMLRVNELELGLLLLKTAGSPEAVLASDAVMLEHRNDWLVRETIGMLRRTLARLDVSSRSMYAIIEPGSCFAGRAVRTGCWPPIAATCWPSRKAKATRRSEDRRRRIELRICCPR